MNSDDNHYKQKYLKYKQKYLDLQQGGLFKPSIPNVLSSSPEKTVANLRNKYNAAKNALAIAQNTYREAEKNNKRNNDSKTLVALEKAKKALSAAEANKVKLLAEYRKAKQVQRDKELENAKKNVANLEKIISENNKKLANAKDELARIVKKQVDRQARKNAKEGKGQMLLLTDGSVDDDTSDEE